MICVLYCLRFIDLRHLFTSVPSDLCIVLSTLHRFTASVYIVPSDLCIVLSTLHRFTASVPSDLCIVLSTFYGICLHQFLVICVLYCLRFIDLRHLFTSVPSDLCIVLSTLHRFTASVYISS